MPEIELKCEFIATGDQILFRTNAIEDKITISNLDLTQEQASGLAWLINSGADLKVEIKLK